MEQQITPTSLLEAIRYFSDVDVCIEFVASLRWLGGVVECPHCGGKNAGFLKTRRIWKCRVPECRKQFSVKTGTWAKLGGGGEPVKVDETFIGGKPKNMHS